MQCKIKHMSNYLNDPREEDLKCEEGIGYYLEENNREEKMYKGGSKILDLCDLPISEYMKPMTVITNGSGDTSINLSGYVTTQDLEDAFDNYPSYTSNEGGVLGVENPVAFINGGDYMLYAVGEDNATGYEDKILATTDYVDNAVGVFWAEVDVTTFVEIKDAIDAGRTVMLKDANEYTYTLSIIYDDFVAFVCTAVEDRMVILYSVYVEDGETIYEESNISFGDFESLTNKVPSISSSSDNIHYPSAKAVWDLISGLASYNSNNYSIGDNSKPISFICSSNLMYAVGEDNATGEEDAILATTDYVDDAIGNLATVATSGSYNDLTNKPTIPQPEVFWAEYGVTTVSDVLTALSNNKVVACKYNNIIHFYMNNDGTYLYFGSAYAGSGSWVRIRISDNLYNRYSFGYESNSNRVSTIAGNETNTNKYPNTKAVADYVDSICGNIQTILTSI